MSGTAATPLPPPIETQDTARADPNAGWKDDSGKTRYDLLLWDFIELMALRATRGAEKYGPNNWQNHGKDGPDRHFAAMIRHLMAWRKGEKIDPDPKMKGLTHMDAIAWNAMAINYWDTKREQEQVLAG